MNEQPDTSRGPGRRPGYVSEKRRFSERSKPARVPENWDVQRIYAGLAMLDEVLDGVERYLGMHAGEDEAAHLAGGLRHARRYLAEAQNTSVSDPDVQPREDKYGNRYSVRVNAPSDGPASDAETVTLKVKKEDLERLRNLIDEVAELRRKWWKFW